eukprot:gnl/MRDRNA2_/MRDRNA2_59907_c0_seq2.p1 gnl/MRDRNA2_/MRDRNA2_59907_c0~~gnl/MRDRNA2_/MRDRNA2_59907_c0_seq2.p1  ORF type:complete len:100 (-),score=8.19 gnl/MRDRNA2_/MRDRNA2_59907_c0_seq2:54-353(-)
MKITPYFTYMCTVHAFTIVCNFDTSFVLVLHRTTNHQGNCNGGWFVLSIHTIDTQLGDLPELAMAHLLRLCVCLAKNQCWFCVEADSTNVLATTVSVMT